MGGERSGGIAAAHCAAPGREAERAERACRFTLRFPMVRPCDGRREAWAAERSRGNRAFALTSAGGVAPSRR